MGKSEPDLFSATMRIEIPPDICLEEDGGKNGNGTTRRATTKKTVHITRNGAAPAPTGRDDFQALLQNIYDAVLITDLDGRIVTVNTRAVQFFGYEQDELLALNVLQIISGATEELLATISKTLQSDRFVLIQACCNRKDDSFFPAEISVNSLSLSGNNCLSFFVRNVTLRKEAEEQLRTSATAIRTSGSGIAVADTVGNLQYCNPAMLRLWGLDENDVEKANIRNFLEDPGIADEMSRTVEKGETWGREVIMKRTDGGRFFAQASAVPNVNPEGALSGMVLSLLDISTLKKAQAELEDYAQRLRQRNADMEDDLRMAREVQLASLPQEYPCFPRGASPDRIALNFSHLYHPSGIVGGDFFDIIPVSDTKAGVLIADVTGHGVKAALIVATIRGLIEQLSSSASDPASFFTQLNLAYSSIFARSADMMLATALYLVLDVQTGWTVCSCAGHVAPFRLRRNTGTVEPIHLPKGIQGPGLGLSRAHLYQNLEFKLEPHDLLLLYTDGLSDVIDRTGNYYDTARLQACLTENLSRPPSELLKEIMADARRFSSSEDFEDDLCLLAVEVLRTG